MEDNLNIQDANKFEEFMQTEALTVGNLICQTRVTSSGRSVRLPPRYLD